MKLRFIPTGIAFGACVGLCTSVAEGMGLTIVMMAMGVLAGGAIGAAMSRLRERSHSIRFQSVSVFECGFTAEQQIRTYWRDKGKIYPMPGHPDPEGATQEADELL